MIKLKIDDKQKLYFTLAFFLTYQSNSYKEYEHNNDYVLYKIYNPCRISGSIVDYLIFRCIPFGEPIDLINVAFEKKSAIKKEKQKTKQRNHKNQNDEKMCDSNFEVPDRITGRNGVVELKQINPKRSWNFVEVIFGYQLWLHGILIFFIFYKQPGDYADKTQQPV